MTTLMLLILAVWFVVLFLGPPIWLALALAGIAFLSFAGIPDLAVAQRLAKSVDSRGAADCVRLLAMQPNPAPNSDARKSGARRLAPR